MNEVVYLVISSLITAIIGYFMGAKMQKVKVEGEQIVNLTHIIEEQNRYMSNLESRFNEKCEWMQKELDTNKELIIQQRVEIDELKKKLRIK